ncbi:MAG: hypothetical protein KGZ88_11885 [Methylomicrobium sp.]|nr:hypothetical protein [Methylomicrobium sp.]
MDYFAALGQLRDKLATISGVNTCAIGLETGLSPDDYPIIRLVPTRFSRIDKERERMELTVYFGVPLTEADQGLTAVYEQLISLESAIKDAIHFGEGYSVMFVDTITDEDRLDHYKLFASRFQVVG